MAFSTISPRRWFWALMCLAGVWCVAGWHWDATRSHGMHSVQSGLSRPFTILLVPPQYIFTGIQGLARMAVDRVALRADTQESREALAAQVRSQAAQIAQLSMQVE